MDKSLSILRSDEEIDLRANRSDIVATLVKGITGAAPIAGPILAETIAGVIPNQKMERLIRWAMVFETKFKHLTEDFTRLKLQTVEGTDLLEDALNQASRAMSDERREYIASLLKNGLTHVDLDDIAKKKLFSILNELNDVEILWLKFYSLLSMGR